MDETNSLIEQRKAKLASLRAKGIDPFKNKFAPAETCAAARAAYAEGREVAIAGRITAHRDMGKSMFIDIRDQSGRIQIYAQKNVLGDEQFDIFRHLDLADFIGVKGTMFTTKTGEISVKLTSFVILTKALRPPPAKWHGLEDTEIRYRQRYLDLMASKAAAPGASTTGFEKGSAGDVLLLRSQIIHEIRQFFHSRGYVEVETPAMQAIPGGAAAQPFKTFHNALGCEFYLRIALELYHKRLLVGGVDKLFEIGKNFRNEGLSPRHNPEFTMLEAYQAFGDYETMMEIVEELIVRVAKNVLGALVIYHPRRNSNRTRFDMTRVQVEYVEAFSPANMKALFATCIGEIDECEKLLADSTETEKLAWRCNAAISCLCTNLRNAAIHDQQFQTALTTLDAFQGKMASLTQRKEVDLTPPWPRKRYKDLVREKVVEKTNGKVSDWFALTPEERRRVAVEDLQMEGDIAKDYEDFEVTSAVFEKLVEPTLIQPTFVTHLPKELVPLAKLSPDDPTTVEVFECCINGQEISPGYTEQNDPIQQRTTLEHQAGGEQQKLDEDFLVALEHGMPPAGGIGIGIDRLCMMLLGQESIRDVILFPQLKPK